VDRQYITAIPRTERQAGRVASRDGSGYVTQANKRVMAASAMEKWDRMSNKSYKPED
jgi:hypothetical protein